MDVHVFPILNPGPTSLPSHLSGSSQCTSPEHPVSCIEPGLAICFTYGNIHVSMLFSQIISASPSPTESKRLFYTSVSQIVLRSESLISPAPFFFLKIALAILGFLYFHTNLEIICSSSVKNIAGRDCIEFVNCFG